MVVIITLSVRAERVSVVDSDVFPDEKEDTFIREPFVVKFSSDVISGLEHFVIVAIHTQPKVDTIGDSKFIIVV